VHAEPYNIIRPWRCPLSSSSDAQDALPRIIAQAIKGENTANVGTHWVSWAAWPERFSREERSGLRRSCDRPWAVDGGEINLVDITR
jgi:hypothetical protein